MKGDNHLLALTTKTITAEDDPTLADGATRVEPLFAFPVQICKVTDDAKSPFVVRAPSGGERKQQYVDTATGEIVEDADCPRGVALGDKFIPIPDEAITEVKGQKSNMIVAEGKMPLAEVDFTRADGFYYVQSPTKGGSPKAYRLTYEALRAQRDAKGKVTREAMAITTKRTPRTNEKVCVIYADEQRECLVLVQMIPAPLLRKPDDQVLAPQQATITDKQIQMATTLIDAMPDGTEFLATAKDDNLERQRELAEQAAMGEPITAPEPIKVSVEQDDLEAMLNASLAVA